MEAVTLKNGETEARALVSVMMSALHNLMESNPIAFYELVMLARDRNHKVFSDEIKRELIDRSLLERRGTMHSSVRNIVQSAVTGELLKMRVGSPIAD